MIVIVALAALQCLTAIWLVFQIKFQISRCERMYLEIKSFCVQKVELTPKQVQTGSTIAVPEDPDPEIGVLTGIG